MARVVTKKMKKDKQRLSELSKFARDAAARWLREASKRAHPKSESPRGANKVLNVNLIALLTRSGSLGYSATLR